MPRTLREVKNVSPRTIRAILFKELLHIFRDGNTWWMVMCTPAILLVMFAYLFSLDVEQFSFGLFDQDNTSSSRQYLRLATSDDVVRIEHTLLGWAEVEELLRRDLVDGVLVIPPAFEADLIAGRQARVQVILDGTKPGTAGMALGEISARSAQFASGLRLHVEPAVTSLEIRERVWYNPSLKSLHSMVPGLIAVVLIMPAFSAAQALAREKELGTLEALLATPVRRLELVIGKGLPYIFTGLMGVFLTAGVAVVWFEVPFRGSFPLFLILGLDFLFAFTFLALLTANFVDSQQSAMLVMFILFFLPSFFMSGLIDPLESAGLAARIEGTLLPTSYFVTISRGIMLKGVGLEHLWGPALALAGLGLAGVTLATLTFRSKLA